VIVNRSNRIVQRRDFLCRDNLFARVLRVEFVPKLNSADSFLAGFFSLSVALRWPIWRIGWQDNRVRGELRWRENRLVNDAAPSQRGRGFLRILSLVFDPSGASVEIVEAVLGNLRPRVVFGGGEVGDDAGHGVGIKGCRCAQNHSEHETQQAQRP